MKDKKIKFRERKPLFALALSLFLTGLGQVYNGKLKKGILLFLMSIILPLLLFQLSVIGSPNMLMLFILLTLLVDLGIYIWAARDAWKQAKRLGKNYILKIYNKLPVYILLIIVLNLFAFGAVFDWQKMWLFPFSPYRMSTGSMIPTVLPGDYVMTDRRIDHSAENHGLKRGEVVVFKYPLNKEKHFIKRLIGLPGDEIEIEGMELFINGERRTGKEVSYSEGIRDKHFKDGTIARYEEGDLGTYIVFFREPTVRKNLSVSVPEGFCFVLGDNRDNSMDSRQWGMIPLNDVLSRVTLIYFSINPEGGIRWGRMGMLLYNQNLSSDL